MSKNPIKVKDITPDLFEKDWLYQFIPSASGDLTVVPVHTKKTSKFSGRLVACKVQFANGSEYWALIEGLDLEAPEYSRHNREIHIFINNFGWFNLAKYFDGQAIKDMRGGEVLARKIGLSLNEIFPIHFDVRCRSEINSDCLHGYFELNPEWGLSRSDVMSLLVKEIGSH